MNCKQGDLAYYVGELQEFHFKIFKCIELTTDEFNVSCWRVYPPLPYGNNLPNGKRTNRFLILDSALRPIRDSEQQDEMLRIVRKPEKINS